MPFRLVLIVALVLGVCAQKPNPVVNTAYGVLNGSWKESANGRQYASFEGVPYARPPVGKYRFREPQQLKPWVGSWDASRAGEQCLQYDPFVGTISGSEDCLFLNVHTPQVNSTASLPVVVYIPGGAFMYGGGHHFGVRNLLDKDIVAVTLNYRLGPLGFLSTQDEVIPGNMGLKDQAFALKWVRDNIQSFGGDPNSVTLTGLSAGGASVHYHYLSPMSRGNFHRGIAFSGAAFASWTQQVRPAQKAKTLADLVGCPHATSRELADCLRHRPAETIVNAQITMFDWKVHMFTPFTPTVEVGAREPFLAQLPIQAAQNAANVPLITSVTSEEGLYPAAAYQIDPALLDELESRWEQLASNIFEYNDTLPAPLHAVVARKIKSHYLKGKPVSQETFADLVKALSDRLFVADVGKHAQQHAARSGQPVHVYRFSFRGGKSLSNLLAHDDKDYGVCHADDVFHIWDFPGVEMDTANDTKVTQMLIDMVYSYATTGTPKVQGVDWTPLQPGSSELNYLEIGGPGQLKMKSTSDFGQKSFWNSLGFLENENSHLYVRDEL